MFLCLVRIFGFHPMCTVEDFSSDSLLSMLTMILPRFFFFSVCFFGNHMKHESPLCVIKLWVNIVIFCVSELRKNLAMKSGVRH